MRKSEYSFLILESSDLHEIIDVEESKMQEMTITCKESGYDLYMEITRYFKAELLENSNNTMGAMDIIKVLVEPVTKSIEVLGNIIISFVTANKCSLILKNGDKEIEFNGNPKALEREEVMQLLNKIFEE